MSYAFVASDCRRTRRAVGSRDGVGSWDRDEIESKAARAASLSFFATVFSLEPVELEDAEELGEAGEPVVELPEPAEDGDEAFLASLLSALSLADDSS